MAFTQGWLTGMALILGLAAPVQARVERGEMECGSANGPVARADAGPFDYRTAPPEKKRQVDNSYFPAMGLQSRIAQNNEKRVADLDTVLHIFPNHLRALLTVAELGRQARTEYLRGSSYSVACWFDRAVRFAPDDAAVRLAYGYWLAKKGERAQAVEQLDRVAASAEGAEALSYNLGLAYCEAGEYGKALQAAHRAYALGYRLPGLRNRLVAAGKWRDPRPAALAPVGEGGQP